MFHYKGFYIWYNQARNRWMLQLGQYIERDYKTAGHAKAAASMLLKYWEY